MTRRLNLNNCEHLIKGASILTTGGGVDVDEQMLTMKNIKNLEIELVSLGDLPGDGYLCMVGELGPSEAPQIKKKLVIKQMLQSLERLSGKRIIGIYPPEIGQESVVLESAFYLGLPVADLDVVGGRAVPFLDISVFNLERIDYSFLPMVVCNDQKEIFTVDGKMSQKRVEDVMREMTTFSSSQLIFLMGGLVSVKNLIKNRLENNSYSRSLILGTVASLGELRKILDPKLLIEGKVKKIRKMGLQGFSTREVYLTSNTKAEYRLVIMNEALFLLDNKGEIVSSVPEKILLIDQERLKGYPGAKLKVGSKVVIAVVEPEEKWRSKRAQQIFGPKRFEYLLQKSKI